MRWRPWIWLGVSLLCFVAALYFWQLGDRWAATKSAPQPHPLTNQAQPTLPGGKTSLGAPALPVRFLSESGNLNAPGAYAPEVTNQAPQLVYRLSNTTRPLGQLAHSEKAVLLENALFDTEQPLGLPIPQYLRAQGDPGAYIVQARGALNNSFRALLAAEGAAIVAYIPNNAYLVRASQSVAASLQGDPQTQAVLPYEPYYKLRTALLSLAVQQSPLPENAVLNVLVFADGRDSVIANLQMQGTEILGEERSPFGPILRVQPPRDTLPDIAGWPGVQAVELASVRVPANDLSRATVGVALDSLTQSNYLNLTGTNVMVDVNDSGVDATHPDLAGRVFFDVPSSGVDSNGHGTHVAGIIAGSGLESTTVLNVEGSVNPATNLQYRGKAPGATLFAVNLSQPDTYLQTMAARTNALISNNSWTYSTVGYDLAAASYDAAVRDSLPGVTGSQSLVYVFPAGNRGGINIYDTGANNGGVGGNAGTITSPGSAKNVITVGAVEQIRNLTNETVLCTGGVCSTNTPWLGSSDSSDQVAGFSSRGNVGIAIEGDFGRFKPDVVAPGTFVVSTRSAQWDEASYYNPSNSSASVLTGLSVASNSVFFSAVYVPQNAVQLTITAIAYTPITNLDVTVTSPSGANSSGVNQVAIPPNGSLDPTGNYWTYTVSNPTPQTVIFSLITSMVTTNDQGNFFDVLRGMNDDCGPYYRYESGTSMAAADVSGTLALMEEFFQQRLQFTNSPALMKALLINGARSLGDAYSLQVNAPINYQGWGRINLPTSLPGALSNLTTSATSSSIFAFDQSPTNALATGQSHTRTISVSAAALGQPLRFTLVWTDPPGDPIASIKLVNDLDLVVTNLDTGDVYFGNDIIAGNDFNLHWNTNKVQNLDVVNNVENIYLKQPLSTNYSVTVVGRHVNVNAVTAHTNDVVQDYALVVSSGDGQPEDALTLGSTFQSVYLTVPNVFYISNSFPYDPENPISGGLLLHQHVGASTPLMGTNTVPITNDANAVITAGMTNQWHFYVLSNDLNFTNASFITFMPPNLAVPRMGVADVANPDNATRPEADIDLYVSTDSSLTNLSTNAIFAADKSLTRGGTEFVVLSNAVPGGIYYVGVKSEDQQAAEFAFLGVFSLFPPTSTDTNGNKYLRGMPLPAVIPPGTTPNPKAAIVLALDTFPTTVRRVIVTNSMTHSMPGGLLGTLSHTRKFSVLNNHTCATDATGNCITNRYDYIYEDNGEGNVLNARHTDGPGSLKDFMGEEGLGVWQFTMVNNFPSSTGVVNQFMIKLEPQNLNTNGVPVDVLPNTFTYDSIDVPSDATNLTVCVSGNSASVDLYIAQGSVPTTTTYDFHMTINPPGGCLSITPLDLPPLTAGRYYIGVYNGSSTVQRIRIIATIYRNPFAVYSSVTGTAGPIPILDDAVTYAYITNYTHLPISSLDVGLLISDPRISDLAITLISPNGTRVLLFEDRGAASTNGLGTFSAITDGSGSPIFGSTNLTAFYTNNFDDVPIGPYSPGAVFDGWHVLSNYVVVYPELPAPWLSNNVLILSDGAVSNVLPTTNSTAYTLSYEVTHAPYLVGMVGWWPFDGDSSDIFGGFDGLLSGDVSFNTTTGIVNQAFFGDGTATRMIVPACPDLDVGKRRGFTIEGWIRPTNAITTSSMVVTGATVFSDGFENATPQNGAPAGSFVSGWLVTSGDVDVLSRPPYPGSADSGTNFLDLNGFTTGSISNGFATVSGRAYLLSFAYTKNPNTGGPNWAAHATVSLTGQPTWQLNYAATNSLTSLNWFHTSQVFVATGPVTQLQLTSLNPGWGGMFLDSFKVSELFYPSNIAYPLVEWGSTTNNGESGVQFWLSGLPLTNVAPGSLWANIWDTNGQAHIVSTAVNAITNSGWQHVALSFNASNHQARIYTNGQLAVARVVAGTNFVPRTTGDLYFGYHTGPSNTFVAYGGGLDEFSLYERPLSDCEIASIFHAGTGGKYATTVLSCPVTNRVDLLTSLGPLSYTFVNGLNWTNGPQWETNTISFNDLLGSAVTNGPATNFTPIIVTPLDPNCTVDNFVLSAVLTNYVSGLLHFTEDTNLATIPIKFAQSPYMVSNFPPTLMFSNEFENVQPGTFQPGTTLPGTRNNPAYGARDWTVLFNPVTVLSNQLVDAVGTNCIALAAGGVQCELPTVPGHRYQLDYAVRGPGIVSWWSGDVEPLSRRAWDVIGGNNGAFIHGATNLPLGLVRAPASTNALVFPGLIDVTNRLASKIDLGDPVNLRLTNAFTLEGWIRPVARSNFVSGELEQLFFRGDSRSCFDPYWLALERVTSDRLDLLFHIEDATSRDCGVVLTTLNEPVHADGNWHHVAAVFESNIILTNGPAWPTNQLRLYLDGRLLTPENQEVYLQDPASTTSAFTDFTGRFPFRDLDPAFSPGVAIGNRSRADDSQPFYGAMDEWSVYGRALTTPEVTAIAASGAVGKADFQVAPPLSLAKVAVSLNLALMDVGYGYNATWTPHSFKFTANATNVLLTLQSLLPGTIVDGITLTELPAELNYLPEESLSALNGEDAYGVWRLEFWDTRTGIPLTNGNPMLLEWQLRFILQPSNPPPVIQLVHGIPYTNTLTAHGIQNFIVQVPQWATNATNVLEFAADRSLTNPLAVGVLWSLTNQSPSSTANAIVWPPLSSATSLLSTNTNSLPCIVSGQAYYLTVTNPNSIAVTFAYGVWFDILALTNCEPMSNFVWQAGIPRYLQFDVPTNAVSPQEVLFWLSGVQSNLTVVLSQHLPLPDLTHYDYISQQPCTNNEVFMVLTNTTPFPIQTNRWYVGIFNAAATNVPFLVQACYNTSNVPIIIPLTNGIPYVAGFTNPYVAPPGPPQWFFFEFQITNYVDAVLFELYNLSGDADLVLQRDVPPGMAPYFDGSFRTGLTPEQIVLRTSYELPDLRGNWFLGVYNNEATNVAYTLRAVVRDNGILLSAQPIQARLSRMPPPRGLLDQWNSVEGENYVVEFARSIVQSNWVPVGPVITATTPLTTLEVPLITSGIGFYRVRQVPWWYVATPNLTIQLWTNNTLRISWPSIFPGETLQYSTVSPSGPWANVNRPVTVEGNEFVVYDTIGLLPKFYRLIP